MARDGAAALAASFVSQRIWNFMAAAGDGDRRRRCVNKGSKNLLSCSGFPEIRSTRETREVLLALRAGCAVFLFPDALPDAPKRRTKKEKRPSGIAGGPFKKQTLERSFVGFGSLRRSGSFGFGLAAVEPPDDVGADGPRRNLRGL